MKRSEIVIGEAYYYDLSRKWRSGGSGGAAKVVALRFTTVGTVEVKGDPPRLGFDYLRQVRPEHLRGPWEATKAVVEAARSAASDQAARARRERTALAHAADAAVDRAAAFGVTAEVRDRYSSPYIAVDVGEFVKLLDRIEPSTGGTDR